MSAGNANLHDIDRRDQDIRSEGVISAHSRIARFYKYRPPYTPAFFKGLATKLRLGGHERILDLCCGRGELASGLSGFVHSVCAVDGSAAMLQNAMHKPNVSFHQGDVNSGRLPVEGKFDHCFIGSAIHWIKRDALQAIANVHFNDRATIVVTHPLFQFDKGGYASALKGLNRRYGRTGQTSPDLQGRKKLNEAGFRESDGLRMVIDIAFGLDYLYMNQLSYAYKDFYDKIVPEPDDYRGEFIETMTPFVSNGRLSASLINWALIYRRAEPG